MARKKKTSATPTQDGTTPPTIKDVERSPQQSQLALRRRVRYFYDLQRLRMQVAGRLGKRAEGVTIDLHNDDLVLLEARAEELTDVEAVALRDIEDHLNTIGFYRDVLSDKTRYRGIGPTMAGVILSEFAINRLDTASKMWAFAGLAPVAATRCATCHVVLVGEDDALTHPKTAAKCTGITTYASGKSMRPTKGEKLPYNAFLKAKMVGVLGSVLLKLNSPWRKFYDDYKHRKQCAGWGVSDGHRHNAAVRYMIKMLLLDIWTQWRTYEKLPVRPSYQEQYLGHVHAKAS